MEKSPEPATKKAYEVSYALFRIAAVLPSRPFAEIIEKEALQLLRSIIGGVFAEAQENLRTLNYLISFGKDTGNIHPANGDILIRQMESLDALVQSSVKKQIAPVDISDIFTSESLLSAPVSKRPSTREPKIISVSEPMIGDRQTVILEKIRQSGNCRTRDLQAAMPDISERTLRYDLQRLIEQGKIERGGGGGPASWYRLREALATPATPEPDSVSGV